MAYVVRNGRLPAPITGAEWMLDKSFNAAEELLRDPTFKHVLMTAIDDGVHIVTLR